MITFHLEEILVKHHISQNQFAKIAEVRPNTINDMVNNDVKRLEIQTLEKIMGVLNNWNYKLEDLIEYSEEK